MGPPPASPSGPGTGSRPGLWIVGFLGGVGSGKSSAARALGKALSEADPGAPLRLLDADAEVGRILGDPETLKALEAAFGPGLRQPDGSLDRRALGARVFGDPAARSRLEALLHPPVRRALHQALQELEEASRRSGRGAWALLDVPLLLEGGLDALCDTLVHVETSAAERARRSRERHGWSTEEWEAREAAQRPVEEKRTAADAILSNEQGPEALAEACRELAARLLRSRAGRPEVRPLAERWPAWDRPPVRIPAPGPGRGRDAAPDA